MIPLHCRRHPDSGNGRITTSLRSWGWRKCARSRDGGRFQIEKGARGPEELAPPRGPGGTQVLAAIYLAVCCSAHECSPLSVMKYMAPASPLRRRSAVVDLIENAVHGLLVPSRLNETNASSVNPSRCRALAYSPIFLGPRAKEARGAQCERPLERDRGAGSRSPDARRAANCP